jgi:hypothetical protein
MKECSPDMLSGRFARQPMLRSKNEVVICPHTVEFLVAHVLG